MAHHGASPRRPARPARSARRAPLLLAALAALSPARRLRSSSGAPAPAGERWPHAADIEKGALAALFRTTLAAAGAGKVAVTSVDYNVDTCRLALDVDVGGEARARRDGAAPARGGAVALARRARPGRQSDRRLRAHRPRAGRLHARGRHADRGAWRHVEQGAADRGDASGTPAARRPTTTSASPGKIHHYSTPDPSDDGPLASSLSEPEYAHWWWPCKDRPDDKFISEVHGDRAGGAGRGVQRQPVPCGDTGRRCRGPGSGGARIRSRRTSSRCR